MTTHTPTRPTVAPAAPAEALTWEPPGPGLWQRETTHIPGGAIPIFQETAPDAIAAGMSRMTARYGLPISHVAFRFVNDRIYMRPIPAIGEKPRKAPPPPVLRVLSRLHPALRPRVGAARRALANRQWRIDGERWYTDQKPVLTAQWLSFQATLIADLDDAALVEHVVAVAGAAASATGDHFELHGCDQIPVGDFLVACARWGIPRDAALAALRGSSPSSLGDRARLERIVAAARRSGGTRPQTLDDIRRAGPDAAAELDGYLEQHGWRTMTSYDAGGITLNEMPEMLLAAILAVADSSAAPGGDSDAAELRARVPESERPAFDELLGEARFAWGIRDDHVGITFLWPSGLLRRSLLEVGRRLLQRGAALDAVHALELHLGEVAPTLAGAGVDAATLARRAALRAAHADAPAPYYIGSEPEPPTPDSFPDAMGRLTAGFVTCINLWWNPPDRAQLSGDGVGRVTYRGTARVTTSADDAVARLMPGDVLVAPYTTPAYNSALAAAGAVVVEEGGPLCHAAIVARELGIAAVVGALGAVTAVHDGDLVEVDPVAGTLRVLERR